MLGLVRGSVGRVSTGDVSTPGGASEDDGEGTVVPVLNTCTWLSHVSPCLGKCVRGWGGPGEGVLVQRWCIEVGADGREGERDRLHRHLPHPSTRRLRRHLPVGPLWASLRAPLPTLPLPPVFGATTLRCVSTALRCLCGCTHMRLRAHVFRDLPLPVASEYHLTVEGATTFQRLPFVSSPSPAPKTPLRVRWAFYEQLTSPHHH